MNPLKELYREGQSIWLDFIRRSLITSGDLNRLIDEDGVRGMTSNPTIFQNAIAGSADYDESIRRALQKNPHGDIKTLYEILAVEDIQMAADVLRPVYDAARGGDGYVSLEVSPALAHDTAGTIAEAERLWKTVGRPNLMIKVPATKAGVPALEELIARGINVNATLMFSLDHYEAIARAYLRGLERCRAPERIASVASFFVSRVDSAVDALLGSIGTPEALGLRGKAAVANAKLTYRRFREIFDGAEFRGLAARGARPQRPLWASTSTKNPEYRDVMYVEQLIGTDTVNTLPPATLNAFRDHGRVAPTLTEGVEEARDVFAALEGLGIDLDAVTDKLQVDGVALFAKSFDELLTALKKKRSTTLSTRLDRQYLNLGRDEPRVRSRLEEWERRGFASRLWEKDTSLWPAIPTPVTSDRLGWLSLPRDMHDHVAPITRFAQEIRREDVRHVVLLGMGGSSLAPEVFQATQGAKRGYPELIVLDSTHPRAIRSVEEGIDLAHALFIVSSKSGGTTETLSLAAYFWRKAQSLTGAPGRRFMAITDAGSPLEALARARGFRRVFEGRADVGGRFSALSVFGLVPAALVGVDIHRVLDGSWAMMDGSVAHASGPDNPALTLGASLGELALAGRDKLTISTSKGLAALPSWIEQLVAESTGKDGKGILPVVDEPLGSPAAYGPDRHFVHIFLLGDEPAEETGLADLERAGHPVGRIQVDHLHLVGQEFFRWEVAVAAAGSILGVHPFNEPDVQAAKELARQAMEAGGASAAVQRGPEARAAVADAGGPAGGDGSGMRAVPVDNTNELAEHLGRWLESASPGDYIGVQAYLPHDDPTHEALQAIRLALRDRTRLATTLGYGPRFLHSTGQIHKGGPNKALFLQIVDDPVDDLAIPETEHSFGKLIRAQAVGDAMALVQRGRRVMRVDLGRGGSDGLTKLLEAVRT
jgi:transaldolase/glucose-6-phosphate isomerase